MTDKKRENRIYDLSLHGWTDIGSGVIVMRVPGGWIYSESATEGGGLSDPAIGITNVFVPYNKEFEPSTGEGEL